MKGVIYKITNNINKKVYIGKTYYTIEKRFKEHVRASRKARSKHRPLYRAFNKYGVENFSHEVLGEYEEKELEDMEVYYIDQFDSYHNGYNATRGGDGKRYLELNEEEVVAKYKQLQNLMDTAKHFKCDPETARKILVSNDIQILSSSQAIRDKYSKKVLQYNLNDELIQEYSSIREAAKAVNGASSHIGACCNGKRQTHKGYKWKFTEEQTNNNN